MIWRECRGSSLSNLLGGEISRTSQFLVLRNTEEDDIGLVIGDPVAAATPQFSDDGVRAGHHYWYRVVALDNKGNRSDPISPAVVRVGAPLIVKPPAPVELNAK